MSSEESVVEEVRLVNDRARTREEGRRGGEKEGKGTERSAGFEAMTKRTSLKCPEPQERMMDA